MAKDKLAVASTDPVDLDATETTEIPISLQNAEVSLTETKSEPVAPELDSAAGSPETAPSTTTKASAIADETTKETSTSGDAENASSSTQLPKAAEPFSAPKSGDSVKAAVATDDDDDVPPPPARPLLPLARIKQDLKDAFPKTDDRVIEAILIASEGRADPAFTALLFLLDPTFKPEPVVAAAPLPPARQPTLTDDELLARQLQKEFEKEDRRQQQRRRKQSAPPPEDDSQDELDQLKETFTQGFAEAKTTINSWVSGLSKKFAPEEEERARGPRQPLKLFGALGGSSFNNLPTHNFDEDPEILASDFRRKADLTEDKPPVLPNRTKRDQDTRWEPLNSDVPVDADAFLVTDLEDEDKK